MCSLNYSSYLFANMKREKNFGNKIQINHFGVNHFEEEENLFKALGKLNE